jgi:EF hand
MNFGRRIRKPFHRIRGDIMKTSKTLIALAIAAIIPLGAATAADQYGKDKSGTMSGSQGFDKLDTNRDGRISQAEASVDTNIVFSSADSNGDGYLDKTEWKSQGKGDHGSSTSPTSPQPQSTPAPSTDPAMPPASDTTTPPSSDPVPSDTETPRQ